MKKIIFSIFALPLIALCCSMNLQAQSSEQDLDQVELMKQFIGTWTAEWGVDTTASWEIIPSDKGYEENIYWKAKGEIYNTAKGIIGFTWEYKKVNMYTLWQDGYISRDLGEFVSDKNIIWERWNADHNHVVATMEVTFQTPDKYTMIFKSRGVEQTWDDADVSEWIWTRVKK